jgi:ABC-type Mn2+/Zn2+ transport system permease subunit
MKGMMVTASLITLFATVSGLFISYLINFAPGPIIVLIMSLIYIASIGISQLRTTRRLKKWPHRSSG